MIAKRSERTCLYTLQSMEERAMLSATFPGFGSPSHGGSDTHVGQNATTPISDFTGTPATLTQIVAISSPGLPHALGLLPAVQDVATLTSASPHVKLRGYSVMIDWGDGTAATRGKLVVDHSGVVHVKGMHAYATVGTFSITVTVTQHLSDSTTPDPTLVVTSTANVTQNSETGVTVNPTTGTEFTGPVGSFATNASNDPLAFTTIVSWGDGTRSVGTVTANGDGTFSVAGTHTYATAGTYRVTVLVYEHVSPAGSGHENSGWHLGWRKHGFFSTISSTAIVADAAPPPPPTA